MDELVRKVGVIDVSLTRSENTLALLKRNAKDEISSDVKQIGTALQQSRRQIENVQGEIRKLLEDVDKETEEEPIVLQPKMTSFCSKIDSIVDTLGKAEVMANTTMINTMGFQSSVSDIEQEIVVQRRELDGATRVGASLRSKAFGDRAASLKLIRETEGEISKKDKEIKGKSSEASGLRTQLSSQRNELSSMSEELERAQARARAAKEKAWGSGLMAVGGLLMAPVTGGASLLLTAGAGAYSVDKAIQYDDIKIVMKKLRLDISGTEDNIRTADRKIAELAAEKSAIEMRLQRLKAALRVEEASRSRSQREIDRADKLSSDIGSLQWQAKAASEEARESVRGLGTLKSNLHEVIGQINRESNQLAAESANMPLGGGSKRLQRRSRAALESVGDALAAAKSKLPATISTSGMKLLESRVASSESYGQSSGVETNKQKTSKSDSEGDESVLPLAWLIILIVALIGWLISLV